MSPNYSNTIIYKLFCKDTNIQNIYIGYTTNFKDRINVHRRCCNNSANKSYNMRMYEFIRNNGGWDNWTFDILQTISCSSKLEARENEKKWMRYYNPGLNTNY